MEITERPTDAKSVGLFYMPRLHTFQAVEYLGMSREAAQTSIIKEAFLCVVMALVAIIAGGSSF